MDTRYTKKCDYNVYEIDMIYIIIYVYIIVMIMI